MLGLGRAGIKSLNRDMLCLKKSPREDMLNI